MPVLALTLALAQTAAGNWSGPIQTPDIDLPVILCFAKAGEGLSGLMESPYQNLAKPLVLTVSEPGPARLTFTVPSIKASWAGQWSEAAQSWTGVWSQSGLDLPLVLKASKEGCRAG